VNSVCGCFVSTNSVGVQRWASSSDFSKTRLVLFTPVTAQRSAKVYTGHPSKHKPKGPWNQDLMTGMKSNPCVEVENDVNKTCKIHRKV